MPTEPASPYVGSLTLRKPGPERRYSLSDPATAAILGGGWANDSGQIVTEDSARGLSAWWRGSMLIAGSIGTLPLKSYRTTAQGERQRVDSLLDDPAGVDSPMTPYEWKETVALHLVWQGETFLDHVYGGAGQLIGLTPIHPAAVSVKLTDHGTLEYTVSLRNGGNETRTPATMTHIPGPISNGLRGMSPLTYAARSLGMSIAAEKSAATMFRKGSNVAGVLTPRQGEILSTQDATDIRRDLGTFLDGPQNAGSIPLINRVLEFQAWAMTNEQAQFLESRAFQVEEIARWLGVPPHLLMALEKTTSWGTGVAEQNKNLSQYVLLPWCTRITDRLSKLIKQSNRFCEFDMAGLEAGSAADEINLLMTQVNGGMLTLNEARRVRNLPPIAGGDQLRIPSGVMLQAQLEASADATVAKTAATEPEVPA